MRWKAMRYSANARNLKLQSHVPLSENFRIFSEGDIVLIQVVRKTENGPAYTFM